MQSTSFLDAKPRHPTALGVAIAVHAGALAALFLAPLEIFPPIIKAIPLIWIDRPNDPQPDDIEAKTRPTPDRPIREVVAPTGIDESGLSGGATNLNDGIDYGSGDTIIDPIEITPDPVLVGPKLDPRFARDVQPPYPPGLQRLEIEGAVTVRILVGADGRVLRLEAIESDHDGFLKATRDWAIRHWRFKPGTRDGVPVEAWRTMTVRFEIKP